MTEDMKQSAIFVAETSRDRVKREAAVLFEKKSKLALIQALHEQFAKSICQLNEDNQRKDRDEQELITKEEDIQCHFEALATNRVSENMLECMAMIEGLVRVWLRRKKEIDVRNQENEKLVATVNSDLEKIQKTIPILIGQLSMDDLLAQVTHELKMAQEAYDSQVQVANEAVALAKNLLGDTAEKYDSEIQDLERQLAEKKAKKDRCGKILEEIE